MSEPTGSAAPTAADVMRRFLATLRQTQFMPPEQMRHYQRGLLERLLRHAREHVPFYRDSGRLDPLFRRDGAVDWDRWAEVPLLTRQDLQGDLQGELQSDPQGAPERLRAAALGPEHGGTWTLSTSGSTSEPVKVVHTELSGRFAWTTVLLRDFERHAVDPTRRLAFLRPFTPGEFDLSGPRRREGWFAELAGLGLAGERFDLADTRPAGELVDAVAALRPAYLHVQPTTLELMLAHDRAGALARLGLVQVITFGEHLSPATRDAVRRQLGCGVLDLYGSNECGFIASTCPHCGGYHPHAETAFVEVIGADGSPCGPGAVGQVVVTPLYNYAMPLIRYDHADEARVAGDRRCRITLPALDAILGKKRLPFRFAGDRAMRPTVPTDAVIDYLDARAFQVAQVAPDRVEFRIVPGRLAAADMRFDDMTRLLRAMWWDGLQVDYRVVERIPRPSPRAKPQMFVCEMPEAGERRADPHGPGESLR